MVGQGEGEEEVGELFEGRFENSVAGGEWSGRQEAGARRGEGLGLAS